LRISENFAILFGRDTYGRKAIPEVKIESEKSKNTGNSDFIQQLNIIVKVSSDLEHNSSK
jgi:hypothetical protein